MQIFSSLALLLTLLLTSIHTASAQTITNKMATPAPPGCYYQQVQCIQAPCPPQLICNTPAPSPKPSPTPAIRCEDLTVASGNFATVPATVVLRPRVSGDMNAVKRYRYYFGDGKQEETTNTEITHKYEVSGKFISRVDIQDSTGKWVTNSSCEATITVKASKVESHKAGCSDVYITAGNSGIAPSTVNFNVTGYDNKADIKRYKLDFGNGVVKEGDGRTFEQIYDQPGTYTVKAYIQDSQNNWQGGENNCKKTLTITAKNQPPLTKQPDTGSLTGLLFMSIGGLAIGILGLKNYKRYGKKS